MSSGHLTVLGANERQRQLRERARHEHLTTGMSGRRGASTARHGPIAGVSWLLRVSTDQRR